MRYDESSDGRHTGIPFCLPGERRVVSSFEQRAIRIQKGQRQVQIRYVSVWTRLRHSAALHDGRVKSNRRTFAHVRTIVGTTGLQGLRCDGSRRRACCVVLNCAQSDGTLSAVVKQPA